MVYSLAYRRPAHVEPRRISTASGDSGPSIGGTTLGDSPENSQDSSINYGIPDALSFDRIIDGGTCPPCTTRDFMNYLIYIEHAAENLQFFLWYKDYIRRFDLLSENERRLAPEWTLEQAEAQALALKDNPAPMKSISADTVAVFKRTDFATPKATIVELSKGGSNPFGTPPITPKSGDHDSIAPSEYPWSDSGSTLRSGFKPTHDKKAAGVFEAADVKLQPFTIQPFREEISRIISIYIAEGAPRQLNLSSKERAGLLHALAATTHPTAFRRVIHTVEWSLRHQAHQNFIRWTICNGNRPRVIFARGLGIAGILGGILAAVLIVLSNAGRGWRVLSAIGFGIGIATLVAAWKGMCVVLHGMHHRHLRPWELFAEDDDASSVLEMKKDSFDTLGSSNSYEDQPWVAKYEKRNLIRKVFDREVWIQEPALRQIQDTIFLQAVLGSLILTAICVGIFVALPKGNFY
ncbi:MAG: hypothetical protein L6R42_002161 [Xanthoria sp. 1 TBL-2021]|nr:MAG: hypothetical protein L6R42_002161 [Xanthoria sp. 1 TBL-2021]